MTKPTTYQRYLWTGLVLLAACNPNGNKPPTDPSATTATAPIEAGKPGTSGTPTASQPSSEVAGWIVVDAQGLFTVHAPPGTKHKKMVGEDSLIGAIDAAGCSIGYDYGGYGSPLNEEATVDGATDEAVTIHGEKARIVTYRATPGGQTCQEGKPCSKVVAVAFPEKLTIHAFCKDSAGVETAKRMFHTVKLSH
jgi:hypothetical protein